MSSKVFLPFTDDKLPTKDRRFFNNNYSINTDFPEFENTTISFFTLGNDPFFSVRDYLEKFENQFKKISISDLGILPNKDLEKGIKLVAQNGSIPIVLAFNNDNIADYLCEIKDKIHVVSNQVSIVKPEDEKDISYIAYQRHFCQLSELHHIDQNSINSLSLGKIRTTPYILEPALRDAEILYIDINCVRCSDCLDSTQSLPSGLNAEELCQLLKYAGNSSKIKAVIIGGNLSDTESNQTGALIAESLWYFIEGVNMQIDDHPDNNIDFSEFVVHASYIDQDLIFIRNNQTHKWWLKASIETGGFNYLPCAYEEYQQVISNEIPERILKFIG